MQSVFLLFVGAMCFAAGSGRRPIRHCTYLHQCLVPYHAFPDPTSPEVLAGMAETGLEGIDRFCHETRNLPRCVISRIRRCSDNREADLARVAASMTLYLCRQSTRESLQEMSEVLVEQGSTCLHEPEVEAQIDAEIDQCLVQFQNSANDVHLEIELGLKTIEDLCPLTQEMVWCTEGAFAMHCHPLLVEFFSGALSHTMEAATYRLGCTLEGTQHTRDVVTAAKRFLKQLK